MGNVVMAYGGIPVQQGIYEESSTKKTDLGRLLPFEDGRCFRYAKCNASAGITKAHMSESPTVVGNESTITQTGMAAQAIGKKVIDVLLTASIAVNLYEDGWFTIESSTGLGQCFRIKSHKAGGASIAAPCELTLYDPLIVATAATSVISLTKNKYANVVVVPTTAVGIPIGVPLITVTTGYYFWAQTKGPAALVADTGDTFVIGQPVGYPETPAVAGAGGIPTITDNIWGVALQVAAADAYGLVDLQLE